MSPPEGDRFWSKVNKDGPIPARRPDLGPCWVWGAGVNKGGYGKFECGGRYVGAHRVSYEWAKGSIPGDLELDHLCRNPPCVNPHHLEPVTGHENILRGTSFSAVNSRKTRCNHGHEFTPENTRVEYKPDGSLRRRICRACARVTRRRYRERLRLRVAA